jgi:hypothetical protein
MWPRRSRGKRGRLHGQILHPEELDSGRSRTLRYRASALQRSQPVGAEKLSGTKDLRFCPSVRCRGMALRNCAILWYVEVLPTGRSPSRRPRAAGRALSEIRSVGRTQPRSGRSRRSRAWRSPAYRLNPPHLDTASLPEATGVPAPGWRRSTVRFKPITLQGQVFSTHRAKQRLTS